MSEPSPKREPLDYETPQRPPPSIGDSVGTFIFCAIMGPIALGAAAFGVIGLANGSPLGLLGLPVVAIASLVIWGVMRERRAAGIAGALTGVGVVLILVGVDTGRL